MRPSKDGSLLSCNSANAQNNQEQKKLTDKMIEE